MLPHKKLQNISEYKFQYLVPHLISAQEVERVVWLLTNSPEWMRAKRKKYSSELSFATDIELAIKGFYQCQNLDDAIHITRLCMARQVVRSHVIHYTNIDLGTLTYLGRVREALDFALTRNDPSERAGGLYSIQRALRERNATHVIAEIDYIVHQENLETLAAFEELFKSENEVTSNPEQLQESVKKSISQVREQITQIQLNLGSNDSLPEELQYQHIQAQLCIRYANDNEIDAALDAAKAIEDDATRAKVLYDVVSIVATKQQNPDLAIHIANQITVTRWRSVALRVISSAFAKHRDYEMALSVTREIEDTRAKEIGQRFLAHAMAKEDHPNAANVFEESLRTAHDRVVRHRIERAKYSVAVATLLADLKPTAEAIYGLMNDRGFKYFLKQRLEIIQQDETDNPLEQWLGWGNWKHVVVDNDSKYLDDYIDNLAKVLASQRITKVTVSILMAITEIAGWESIEWEKVFQLICKS